MLSPLKSFLTLPILPIVVVVVTGGRVVVVSTGGRVVVVVNSGSVVVVVIMVVVVVTLRVNVAVTVLLSVMVMLHVVLVPLQAPLQPVKVAVLSGVSVSFTSLFVLLKRTVKPVQLSGQFVPLSLVTVPLPVPAFATVSLS